MTKTQANELLDMRRNGATMPMPVIVLALQTTGDIPKPYGIADALQDCAVERGLHWGYE